MKDQYFGDINDYRKYGLLRSILRVGEFKLLIAWMLTPDDGSTDGKFISFLENADRWSAHDPQLFCEIRGLLSGGRKREVCLIEKTALLTSTEFFSDLVPDSAHGRGEWTNLLFELSQGSNFIFFDPDNGLEVRSRPYGRKNSSKFLYWHEVEKFWAAGKSMLIYQHFIREKRERFIQRMLKTLGNSTPGSLVEAFSTSNVVFLMALQPEHQQFHEAIVHSVQENWAGQIDHSDLVLSNNG